MTTSIARWRHSIIESHKAYLVRTGRLVGGRGNRLTSVILVLVDGRDVVAEGQGLDGLPYAARQRPAHAARGGGDGSARGGVARSGGGRVAALTKVATKVLAHLHNNFS